MSAPTCAKCDKPLTGAWFGIRDKQWCMSCGAERMAEIVAGATRAAASLDRPGDVDRALRLAASTIRSNVGEVVAGARVESTAEWRQGMVHAARLIDRMLGVDQPDGDAPAPPPRAAIESSADGLFRAAVLDAGVPMAEIRGRGRDPRTVHARDLVCARLRAAGLSLPTIGRLVGRDHSTVLYALRKVADPEATRERNRARGSNAKKRHAARMVKS